LEFLIYCASFIVESYKSCIFGDGAGPAYGTKYIYQRVSKIMMYVQ